MKTRILSFLLSIVMVFSLIPTTIFATEKYVYLSISFDGKYINDKMDNPIVYMPISLSAIESVDLTEYGLDNMLYDADGDGDYETTALQLLIYAHEELYGGDWSDVDFDALPGSSYFKGGIFGFTENLMYFHNGDFPVDESQASEWMTVGATSDRIVLQAGDFLDVASFNCFSFLWDQLGGFHFFADEQENLRHDFTAKAGETLSIKLMHSFCDLMFGNAYLYGASEYEIFYGKTYGKADGTLVTDGDGNVDITIDDPGTYYIWCYGANGSEDGTHGSCDYYYETGEPCIVSAPGYAKLTITESDNPKPDVPEQNEPEQDVPEQNNPEQNKPEQNEPEQDKPQQDVSSVLNNTMAQLANTVTSPEFGTNAGEWTVFSLARGEYFKKDDAYFTDYYNRIVGTVNALAKSINKNGALDKNKSTENSRLIVALSSIGRDATAVGDWNLVEAYSSNGINWIKKQGMNGTIWTLIALDSNNYATSDTTIRQQCVDAILEAQHNDGGWSLVTNKTQPSNVDITCMTLTALYPYREQPEVAKVCETAIKWLSDAQLETGGFPYGSGETSESCAWAIVALTTWGINPDTDARFIKNGKSAVDNLLSYYIEDKAMFAHQGTEPNAMATDQACYALVAYQRFINNQTALYDMSDVTFENVTENDSKTPSASLGLPKEITNTEGEKFNAVLSLDHWNNEAGYKLMDLIMSVPKGLKVTGITAGSRLNGGEVSYHLEEETGKLRVVYFDAKENSDLIVSGTQFPAEFFTINFEVAETNDVDKLDIRVTGMSLKKSSDSTDESAMTIVDVKNAGGSVEVVKGISYSAVCLYSGDDIDLIPSTKKAVTVSVTGIEKPLKLVYDDGTYETQFKYSDEISKKSGVITYVALVNSAIEMEQFSHATNFELGVSNAPELAFGDSNGDGVVNAQDALAAVDTWLRKTSAPSNDEILALNVNGDGRINTFDALGIVEAFVNGSEYIIVNKAMTLTTK